MLTVFFTMKYPLFFLLYLCSSIVNAGVERVSDKSFKYVSEDKKVEYDFSLTGFTYYTAFEGYLQKIAIGQMALVKEDETISAQVNNVKVIRLGHYDNPGRTERYRNKIAYIFKVNDGRFFLKMPWAFALIGSHGVEAVKEDIYHYWVTFRVKDINGADEDGSNPRTILFDEKKLHLQLNCSMNQPLLHFELLANEFF